LMQRTPGKSVEAREKYWTKIIIAARAFPEGITAYCRFMNVSKNNYYFWFKRLRQQHPDWHDLSNYPEIVASSRQKQPVEGEEPTPATKVEINTRRRKWSIPDKTRLLEETDNAEPSELGAILRREGIYVHTLNKWRTQRDLLDLAQGKKGPRRTEANADNKKLKEEIIRLEKKLRQANEIIKLQKKISDMMGNLSSKED
jgi:transposase